MLKPVRLMLQDLSGEPYCFSLSGAIIWKFRTDRVWFPAAIAEIEEIALHDADTREKRDSGDVPGERCLWRTFFELVAVYSQQPRASCGGRDANNLD